MLTRAVSCTLPIDFYQSLYCRAESDTDLIDAATSNLAALQTSDRKVHMPVVIQKLDESEEGSGSQPNSARATGRLSR